MAYHSKYSGAEVDALLDKIKNDDVGSIDSSLSTTSENPVKNRVITEELNKKVDKVEGKQLSTEDFTSELKGKLDGLSNYDDTNLKGDLEVLKGKVDKKQDYIADLDSIRSGANKGSTALQEHQDISHLLPKSDFETYATETDTKLTELEDLDIIREGASKGATALQSYTETDPIYLADKPNLALKSEIPDISGKADKTTIVTETEGNASYSIAPNRLTRLGTLASAVTLSLDTSKEESGVTNVYDIVFTTPAYAPSITWPEGISWVGGSAPAIARGKTYEVSIMDNLATYGEF